MKRNQRIKLAATMIVVIVLLFGVVSAASAGTRNPFIGPWEAVDIDNSNLRLTFAGGGQGIFRLIWLDDYWSVCDGDPGLGRGTGTIDDTNPNLMHTSIDFFCGNAFWGTLAMDFEYDPGTDTIMNTPTASVIWNRVSGGP